MAREGMRTPGERSAYTEGYANGGRAMIGKLRIAFGEDPETTDIRFMQAEREFKAVVETVLDGTYPYREAE